MNDQLMEFSDRVGVEMWQLLTRRAEAELSEVSGNNRLTATLGAALIAVTGVLREPVERGWNADEASTFCAKWISDLLKQIAPEGGE
jgi:hypothetical protein